MLLNKVLEGMNEFMTQQGFSSAEDGVFVKDEQAVRVVFNESAAVYELHYKNGQEDEQKISSYLFDGERSEADAEAVAIDFVETMRTKLGIKRAPNKGGEIELPKELKTEKIGINGFMQKLLAIFPQYKETYKAHVAQYGKLLPVEFCHQYFVPSVRELLNSGNKKSIKKFYDAMTDLFVAADGELVPYVVGLLAAGINGNQEVLASFKEQTAGCASLYPAVINFDKYYQHNKKLKNCL